MLSGSLNLTLNNSLSYIDFIILSFVFPLFADEELFFLPKSDAARNSQNKNSFFPLEWKISPIFLWGLILYTLHEYEIACMNEGKCAEQGRRIDEGKKKKIIDRDAVK